MPGGNPDLCGLYVGAAVSALPPYAARTYILADGDRHENACQPRPCEAAAPRPGRPRPGRVVTDTVRAAAGRRRRLHRELGDILASAAGALIDQLVSVGITDPADIARRLNRRGFPCFGRSRWTAGAVRGIQRCRLRREEAA